MEGGLQVGGTQQKPSSAWALSPATTTAGSRCEGDRIQPHLLSHFQRWDWVIWRRALPDGQEFIMLREDGCGFCMIYLFLHYSQDLILLKHLSILAISERTFTEHLLGA